MRTTILILVSLLALAAGCANPGSIAHTGTVASGAISTDFATIDQHANQALSLVTSPAAATHLKAIHAAATDGQQQVPKVEKAIADLQKQVANGQAALAAERNHWLGFKARVALTTIAIVAGAWLAAMIALWFFIPAAGPLFANALRVGLAGLSKFGQWVERSIESQLQKFNAKIRAKLALAATPLSVSLTK